MKFICSSVAVFALLLSLSSAFSFGPSAYVFSEADLKNNTRTTTPKSRHSLFRILFPTAASHVQLNTTTASPRRRTTASTTESSLSTAVVSKTTENYQQTLNATLPTIEGGIFNHTRSNETRQICKPERQSEPKPNSSTSFLTDEYIRNKLCSDIAPANLSREYRFDLDAKVCSPVGRQSHCGKNMVFYSIAGNSVYGHCDCSYSSRVPLVYHGGTNRCYFMYQQGFCKQDEWVELRKGNGTAICSRNKCYDSGREKFGAPPLASRDAAPEYVPLRGDGPCVKLDQPNPEFCKGKKGDVVSFRWPLEFYPNCGELSLHSRFVGAVSSIECNPGSYLSEMGSCQPDWEFD